jgi:hypothetical protein
MFAAGWIPSLREKLSSLCEFDREIKVGFARFYNKRHNRRGYFWGDRFKSVIVEKGETLINCLAYIDLNPLFYGFGGHRLKRIRFKNLCALQASLYFQK